MTTELIDKLACPFCGTRKSWIVNSQFDEEHERVLRIHQCDACDRRWQTEEKPTGLKIPVPVDPARP